MGGEEGKREKWRRGGPMTLRHGPQCLNPALDSRSFILLIPRVQLPNKVLAYYLMSVGPGADPGVQAVSPQVTF